MKKFLRSARDRWRHGRDHGGTFTYFAFALVPLVGFTGLMTDGARAYFVKAHLSQGIDAAGLAGARLAGSDPNRVGPEINMIFRANFPTGYLDATVNGPHFTMDADEEVVTVTASATIPTVFMRVFGIDTVTVSASTEVTRKTNYLDLVMVFDSSGSMGERLPDGEVKIDATRAAAKELVNILFGSSETKDLLKIGIVPFNGKVNVTDTTITYRQNQTTVKAVPTFKNPLTGNQQSVVYIANNSPVPLTKSPPSTWKGCVYQRYIRNSFTTDDADTVLGPTYSTRGDWVAWEPVGIEGEPVSGSTRCSSAVSSTECTPCGTYGITALKNTKSELVAAIDRMTNPNGTTNIPQGMNWGWQVLTPEPPFTEADPNPPGKRIQALVLLSDGENVAGSGDGYKGTWGLNSTAQSNMNSRLRTLATNMKTAGVVIYTIQFGYQNSSMATLLKDVATGRTAPYYNYAPDSAALKQVFQEVANHLSELRISK